MADFVFKMPDVGEGIAEAEIVAWSVGVGDAVSVDQPVVEVMTEKATVEIASPVAGTVRHLGGEPGASVAVGAELIRLDVADGSEPPVEAAPPPAPRPAAAASDPGPSGPPPTPVPPVAPAPTPDPTGDRPPAPAPNPAGPDRRPLASPAVRQRALDAGVDLRLVAGTGPGHRIGHDDLDRHLAHGGTPATGGRRPDTSVTDVPVIGLRRRIAAHMSLSKARIPHITYVEEVDVTALEELRSTLNRDRAADERITLLPFLVRALVRSVAEFPAMNAHFDDEAGVVHRHGGVHVGIATQTPSGLVVPVLRHAEAHGLWSSAAEIRRLATAAREGRATREELTGSTITISSLGPLGGLVTTPVINHPEVAIVGVNKIQFRPVWDGSNFVPRQMMNLSSGFDHRVIDGWDAASFVRHVKDQMEQPTAMFMEGA